MLCSAQTHHFTGTSWDSVGASMGVCIEKKLSMCIGQCTLRLSHLLTQLLHMMIRRAIKVAEPCNQMSLVKRVMNMTETSNLNLLAPVRSTVYRQASITLLRK